ncbi:hypothetical protein [Amycolatopsis minnesotensis]|uniref:Cadherin domain-containing protein n=1 Tax=Amycolatopsis minnesotensis TaxID=337894 RepID=A0ABN2PZY5_9PSEU
MARGIRSMCVVALLVAAMTSAPPASAVQADACDQSDGYRFNSVDGTKLGPAGNWRPGECIEVVDVVEGWYRRDALYQWQTVWVLDLNKEYKYFYKDKSGFWVDGDHFQRNKPLHPPAPPPKPPVVKGTVVANPAVTDKDGNTSVVWTLTNEGENPADSVYGIFDYDINALAPEGAVNSACGPDDEPIDDEVPDIYNAVCFAPGQLDPGQTVTITLKVRVLNCDNAGVQPMFVAQYFDTQRRRIYDVHQQPAVGFTCPPKEATAITSPRTSSRP